MYKYFKSGDWSLSCVTSNPVRFAYVCLCVCVCVRVCDCACVCIRARGEPLMLINMFNCGRQVISVLIFVAFCFGCLILISTRCHRKHSENYLNQLAILEDFMTCCSEVRTERDRFVKASMFDFVGRRPFLRNTERNGLKPFPPPPNRGQGCVEG